MTFSTSPLNDTETRMQRQLSTVYYAPGATARRIVQVAAGEIQDVRDALTSQPDQMRATTVTYGIDALEAEVGLASDDSLTLTDRQQRVLARMRVLGVASLKAIAQTAAAYTYGDVDVFIDYPTWTFVIQFKGERGIPSQLLDLQLVVRERIPTVYRVTYWFRYTTYGDIKAAGVTYGRIRAQGVTYGQLKTWTPVP